MSLKNIFGAMTQAMVLASSLCLLWATVASAASGQNIKKAQDLFFLLTGTQLMEDNTLRAPILEAIESGDLKAAAELITDRYKGSRYFYDTVVRNFASTFNRTETANLEATDVTALIIGIARDELPFDDILLSNYFYRDPSVVGENAYREDSNRHFNFLDRMKGFREGLEQGSSGNFNVGIFTRRGFAEDFYLMGTNRRPWKAIVELLYLVPLDTVASLFIPDGYVRRDVPRIGANGTTEIYQTSCRGCHAMMDPISFAFGVFDFNTDGAENRIDRLATFRDKINEINGPTYKPNSDEWWLYVTAAQNEVFGFVDVAGGSDAPALSFAELGGDLKMTNGKGVRNLARVIAASRGFARGLVTRVVSQMYLKKVWSLPNVSESDRIQMKSQSATIEKLQKSLNSHRSLKALFEEAAIEYLP